MLPLSKLIGNRGSEHVHACWRANCPTRCRSTHAHGAAIVHAMLLLLCRCAGAGNYYILPMKLANLMGIKLNNR